MNQEIYEGLQEVKRDHQNLIQSLRNISQAFRDLGEPLKGQKNFFGLLTVAFLIVTLFLIAI